MKKELTAKQIQSNGGKKRWAKLSKKERSELGKMMAKIRHSKKKDIEELSTV